MTRQLLAKLVEEWRNVLIPEWRITLMTKAPPDKDMENHELLHALVRPWRRLVDAIEDDLPARAHHALSSEQEHQEEALVDRLSYVLVAQTYGAEAFGTIERTKDDED